MPWAPSQYPDSMKNLAAQTRRKAIDIANALLKDGYDEGKAIAIATSQAEKWAEKRDLPVKKTRRGESKHRTDGPEPETL